MTNTQGAVCFLRLVKTGCLLKLEFYHWIFCHFLVSSERYLCSLIPGGALWLQSFFLQGKNCVPDVVISWATLISRFLNCKGELIKKINKQLTPCSLRKRLNINARYKSRAPDSATTNQQKHLLSKGNRTKLGTGGASWYQQREL